MRGHMLIFRQIFRKSVFYHKIPLSTRKHPPFYRIFFDILPNLRSWNKMKQNEGSYVYILKNILKKWFLAQNPAFYPLKPQIFEIFPKM